MYNNHNKGDVVVSAAGSSSVGGAIITAADANNNNSNANAANNNSNNASPSSIEGESLASESYKVICGRLGIKPNASIVQQLVGTDMAVACKSTIDASQTFLGSHGVDALCELLILHQGIRHISLPANGLIQANVTAITQAARSHSSLESMDLSNNKNLSTPAAREIWESARVRDGSFLVETKVDGTAIPAEWKQRIQKQLEINREQIEYGFDSNPQPRPRDQWLEVRIFLLAERSASEAVEKFMERSLSLLNAAGASWRVRFSCLVHFDDMLASQSSETVRGHLNNCACSMNYGLPWIIVFYTQEQPSPPLRSFVKEFIEPLSFPELPPLYTKFGARREPLRKPFPSVFMMRVPSSFGSALSAENSMSRDGSFYSAGGGSFRYGSGTFGVHGGASTNSGEFTSSFSASQRDHHQNQNRQDPSAFSVPTTKAVRFFNSARYPECAVFLRLQTDMLVSLRGVFYTPRDNRVIDFWTDAPDAFREGLGRLAAQFQWDSTPSEVSASMAAQSKEVEQIYNYATRTMTTQNAAPLLVYGSRGVGRRSVVQAALWHVREDHEEEQEEEQQQQQQNNNNQLSSSTAGDINSNNSTNQTPGLNESTEGAFSTDFYQSAGSNLGGVILQQPKMMMNKKLGSSINNNQNDATTGGMNNTSINNNNINPFSSSMTTSSLRIIRWDMSINNSLVQFLLFLLDAFVPENRPLPTAAHNGNIDLLMLTVQQAIRQYNNHGKKKIVLAIYDVDLIDNAWATGINPFAWFPLAFPSSVRLICTCATESNFLSEMRAKEQQPFDLLIRGGKRATLCKSLRQQWDRVTTSTTFMKDDGNNNDDGNNSQKSSSSSGNNHRPFVGLGSETEQDEYHTRPSPPTSLPPTVASAILSKQDSELFLYVNLFASWIALECEDLGTDETMMTSFIHEVAPQTTHDLIQRMIQKVPFIIDKTDSLADRKARVFNTIACLCCAPALTSNEISRVCEQVYNNRRHSIVPLLTVLEHFGLITKRFDGCLAPAHPVIRTAFESFIQRDPSVPLTNNNNTHNHQNTSSGLMNGGYGHQQNQNEDDIDADRYYDDDEESQSQRRILRQQDIWGFPPISPLTFRQPVKQQQQQLMRMMMNSGDGSSSGSTSSHHGNNVAAMMAADNSTNAMFQALAVSQISSFGFSSHHNHNNSTNNNNNNSSTRVPPTMELDACRSAFAVIHYHAVSNLTVGFIRSFSILPDLLIHSAQPQKLVQLLGDVVLLDSIVREHSLGSIYVVDAMIRAIHHLSALSRMFTIEGYTRHQFSHSADLGRLTRSLRDFLKIRSGNLWQAALALQHDSTLFQNATKQFDKAPYPSLCLRNRTDSELQSLETHVPKFPSSSSSHHDHHHHRDSAKKSLRHCCLSDPFLSVTCESGFVTIYEITKIGGLRVAAKQAQNQQQQQQQSNRNNTTNNNNNNNNSSAASASIPSDEEHHQCFRELCSFDFSTIGFDEDSILGCIISSGLNPTALVVFVDHCAIWRFGESSKSPSYISKIENCTASLRHEVFAPGGATFTGVAFLEGDGAPTAEEASKSRNRAAADSSINQQQQLITATTLAARDVERKVVVIDVASAKIISVVNHPSAIFVREAHYAGASGILVIEPQGIVMCRNDGTVLQMRSHHLSQAHSIRASAHNRDGSLVGVVSGDRAMMWHVGRNYASHEEMPLHTVTASSPLLDLTFVPSGAQAAIAAENGNILMWNTITGLLHQTLRLDTPDPPAYCIFTSNGRLIARAGTALRMWDVVTNQDMGGIVAHEGVVNYIEASGSLLATCCDCGTVKIWDATPSLPPLTKLKDSGKPTNDLYRFGFVGPHQTRKIAVSDDSSFLVIQIGDDENSDQQQRNPSSSMNEHTINENSMNPGSNISNNKSSSSLQTTLWAVDLDRSPIGEYDSTAPFIRNLPAGLTSSPLFLRHLVSSAQRAQEEEEDEEDEDDESSYHHNHNNNHHHQTGGGGGQRGRSPVDDPTILLFVNSEKELVKHFCESGESIIIGELPREILDGYVEMYHCSDYNNNNNNTAVSSAGSMGGHHFGGASSSTRRHHHQQQRQTSSTSIAISTGKTLGGCRIVLFDVPLGSSTEPATLIAQLIGHGAPIIGIDYLQTAIVSAGQDKQLIMWSTTSYAEKVSKTFDAPLVAFARIFEGEYRSTTPGTYCVADANGGVMIVDCVLPPPTAATAATSSSLSENNKTATTANNNNNNNNNNNSNNNNTHQAAPTTAPSPAWKINVLRKVMLPHCVLMAQPLLNPNTLLISLEGSEGELFVWDTVEMKPVNRIEITRSSSVTCMTMVSPQVVESNPAEVDDNGLLVFAGTTTGVVKMYSVEG